MTLRAEWQECPYVIFANDTHDLARKVINFLSGKYDFDGGKIREWALERLKTLEYVAQRDLEVICSIMEDSAEFQLPRLVERRRE